MKTPLIATMVMLSLSACGLEDALDEEIQAQDTAKCQKRGFTVGTGAMATCLQTLSNERQAEQARADANYRASEARKQASKQTNVSSVPVSTRPTSEIMGVDPDTANMSMCSDGALREDCSFAPLGY